MTGASPASRPSAPSDATPRAQRPWARFVLVRHGEAEGNHELRYLGSADVPLTPRGQAQALQLAQAAAIFPLAAIYTSPLQRARATAEALAAITGVPVQPWIDLREEDFGAWEQLTHAEVRQRDGDLLAAWEAGADIAPPGGESLTDVRARVVAAADTLALRHAEQTVALVCHVGPIKALICAALGLPAEGARRMWLDPASISVLDWQPGSAGHSSGILRVFNAIAHLTPPARWLES